MAFFNGNVFSIIIIVIIITVFKCNNNNRIQICDENKDCYLHKNCETGNIYLFMKYIKIGHIFFFFFKQKENILFLKREFKFTILCLHYIMCQVF
ncbi:hypothetical protein BY996DRAFT_654900 [Phakopsora pachyrhizi]|nr:hypothetical protein BY996DRAFT_654900 [Phakopsora pachyrhizi]